MRAFDVLLALFGNVMLEMEYKIIKYN